MGVDMDKDQIKELQQQLKEATAKLQACRAAFEPVVDWYDGEGECDDLADMIAAAVGDLQEDRAQVLGFMADIESVIAIIPPEVRAHVPGRGGSEDAMAVLVASVTKLVCLLG